MRIWSLALFGAVALSQAVADTRGSKELEDCHLDNYRQEILCGTHEVFEDRVAASGRRITIHFAVVPAVGEIPNPDPVVVFAGGPGQSARSLAPLARAVFADAIETRDLVLIDQRGMGASGPLECDFSDLELDLSLSSEERRDRARTELGRCLSSLDADVTLYTQDLANADIHEILNELGYGKANLYGGSWGTRSALLYAHRYPDHVRSIILDGALPLKNTAPIHAAEDADRALRAVFTDCANSPDCNAAFPDLERQFGLATARLAEQPKVTIADPSTGEDQIVAMDAGILGGMLRSILYVPELVRVVPLIIAQASEGRFDALFGVSGYLNSASGDLLTIGASLTIFCSEELARADGIPAGETLVGQSFLVDLENACTVWPRAPLPAIYSEEVRSEAPTLILSGDIDPITPPRWGDAIAQALPHSVHLIAPNTGHGVAPVGCAPSLIADFIERASVEELDASCLEDIQRPSFFVDSSGPATP